MPTSFRPYHPDQPQLFPPDPRDWLPDDHLAFFVSDTVDAIDLSGFYARYEGDGRRKQPFEPRMMVKLLIYGYATGVFSSRKIARKLHEDVAFRVLCAGNFPAHRTIAEFRQRHLGEFESLFVQVVRIAQEVGLIKLGTLALDGSKVKANASKHKAMSYSRMLAEEKRLRKEIRELTQQARLVDEQEDVKYGVDRRGDELPEELSRREKRLATIRAARDRLERRQREADEAAGREPGDEDRQGRRGPKYKRPFGRPPDKAQENFTDPDSRIMKCSTGYEQCYNAQLAVDDAQQLIVAAEVTQQAVDNQQLRPLLDAVRTNTGRTPKRVLADAGYRSEENFVSLKRRRIDGYVALGRGEEPARRDPTKRQTREMARKLRTKRGREVYRRRKAVVESPFGWIKGVLGFRSYSLRGVEKVAAEWKLVCLAVNLRRMNGMMAWA